MTQGQAIHGARVRISGSWDLCGYVNVRYGKMTMSEGEQLTYQVEVSLEEGTGSSKGEQQRRRRRDETFFAHDFRSPPLLTVYLLLCIRKTFKKFNTMLNN